MDDLSARIGRLGQAQAALLDAMLSEAAGPIPAGTYCPRAVMIRPGGDEPPLFFVHGSGGRVLFLHALGRALPASLGLWGLEAGIANGPAGQGSGDAIDRYVAALREVQPRGPYRLGGYSAGALIAFEMTRRLEKAGEHVAALLFVDPIAPPQLADARPARRELTRRLELARLAGVTPLSSEFAMISRVDHEISMIAQAFRPKAVAAPLSVIRASIGDDALSPEGLDAWAGLAKAMVSAIVEADHFSIVREPAIAHVAALIAAWIADADPR